MNLLAAASKLAFVGTQFASRQRGLSSLAVRRSRALSSHRHHQGSTSSSVLNRRTMDSSSSQLFSSSSSGSSGPQREVQLQNIGKEQMKDIVEKYEQGGREGSGYVILDVREPHEIDFSGKLSPNTLTLPLQKLGQYNVFALPEDEFEEVCGFDKPTPDETLVFSCAAGIRSVHASQFAAQNGYTKLVNYMGGANEWFY